MDIYELIEKHDELLEETLKQQEQYLELNTDKPIYDRVWFYDEFGNLVNPVDRII
tara:strand:+ start:143 stop:307 length:165 start_codon:yes stop_codon:yes gene_type:complete